MRIAIVNDLLSAVEVLKRVIKTVPEYSIAWIAYDGAEAVEKCSMDVPDLILMDLVMPVMNGVESTKKIMENTPCPILVVTLSIGRNVSKVFRAMSCGALDAVKTPSLGKSGRSTGAEDLLDKIVSIELLIKKEAKKVHIVKSDTEPKIINKSLYVEGIPTLIALGASTGGPGALLKVLQSIPSDVNASFVIVQHVDMEFVEGMAEWFDSQIQIPVEVAKTGSVPQQGEAFLAGTRNHIILTPELTIGYTAENFDNVYCPSVDIFFESLVKYWPGKCIGVLLTGMGNDGARGLKMMKDKGWYTIAQDEESSVVYGMPKAAVEEMGVVDVLPIDKIGGALTQFLIDNEG